MVLVGSAFGAWVSGLVGISVPNREIKGFEAANGNGPIHLIRYAADVNREKVRRVVGDRHPSVIFGGEEGAVPPAV